MHCLLGGCGRTPSQILALVRPISQIPFLSLILLGPEICFSLRLIYYYSAGDGSAAILRIMLPYSRRVRWLSANIPPSRSKSRPTTVCTRNGNIAIQKQALDTSGRRLERLKPSQYIYAKSENRDGVKTWFTCVGLLVVAVVLVWFFPISRHISEWGKLYRVGGE